MDYGAILSRAAQITWRHKVLWIFGILASLGSGSSNFDFRIGQQRGEGPLVPPEVQRELARPELVGLLIIVGCVLLVVVLTLFVLSVIARGGLIGGGRLAAMQQTLTFGEGWHIGRHYFWRLLGLMLLLIAPLLLFSVCGAVVGVLTAGLGFLCLLPLICLLVPVFTLFAILAHFAQFAVVLEDMAVADALRRAWQIIKTNLGPIIVLGIIMLVIGGLAGLVLAAPFFALIVPTVVLSLFARDAITPVNLALVGLGLLCYTPVAIVLSGILQTWTTTVWTLAYEQFAANTANVASTTLPPAPAM